MLKSLTIENYRSCLRTRLNLHPHLSVLIGPNSSGKTNILQAVMLLNKLAQEPEHHARPSQPVKVVSRLKATFGRRQFEGRLQASLSLFTDESNNDKVLASEQKWTFTSQGKKYESEIPLGFAASFDPTYVRIRAGLAADYYYYYHRHSRLSTREPKRLPAGIERKFGSIGVFCRGFRYYGASQFTNPSNCPTSFQIEREGGHSSLQRIRGHAKIFYDMYSAYKTHDDSYKQFAEVVGPGGLRLIEDLSFREVQSSSTDYNVRVGGKVERRKRENRLVIPQFKIGHQILSPNQLSEGTFKTLALLFHLYRKDSKALLIEEPEVCVHHGLLASILEIIKSASERKQIILSTHSDYVLDHVKPENVYRITFDKGSGTIARQIRETMTSKEYGALRTYLDQEGNLGEYWREGGLGDRP